MDTQQSNPTTESQKARSHEQVSTHVMVPKGMVHKLRVLAQRTRIHQSEYLREAVQNLLAKYREPQSGVPSGVVDMVAGSDLRSVVFRLHPDALKELKELARATRVRQSEYLREAIEDVLTKYKDKLQDEEPVGVVANA